MSALGNDAPTTLVAPTAPAVPLVVSIPHTGVLVPPSLRSRMTAAGARLADTDWHLDRLYDFVPSIGGTLLCATFHRYVVDLNRPKDGQALYPGRRETELCPTTTFDDQPIWQAGHEPTDTDKADRIARIWQPYHDRLHGLLRSTVERFGYALVWDAHSIRSFVPRFSPSGLPDFMLGDVDGTSAEPALADAVFNVLASRSAVAQRNAPFKGGYITRSVGRPGDRVHALQLEMSQRLYMDETTFAWNDPAARVLAATLRAALLAYLEAGERLATRA